MEKQNSPGEPEKKKTNKLFPIIFITLVVIGAVFGTVTYIHSQHYENTDDAQVQSDISPVIPKVSGYISEIRIEDNQLVRRGDTLVILEGKDFQLQVDQAHAAYENALANLTMVKAGVNSSQSSVNASQANIATVEANIEVAKVRLKRASQDYTRYANLFKDHSITQQQFEESQAAKESAEKQLEALQRQKTMAIEQRKGNVSNTQVSAGNVEVADANVKMQKAKLDLAQLQLSYTIITAPIDGVVSSKNAEVGQLVQQGQSLFALVKHQGLWVVANFKETQLEKLRPGQKVEISVDAYPDITFGGKVASLAAATGSKFSLLPPDNATGNFVKVVQRVPVKIIFTDQSEKLDRLRAGMNVVVEVSLD
jgi:membrane fusion protein (multidrug efflux system)